MKNFAEINRASTGAKKTFNFFEKLWEHSRTLRRVGLVLVMCLISITQVWAYKITGGHTIYFDNYIAGWTGPQMQVKQNESNKPVYEFTQIGTTSFYYKVFSNDWDGYDGIYYFNWTGSNWGNKSTYERYDINSDVVIVAKSSSDNTAIGKFTTFQKAYPDNRIYFDATGATGWGDKAYFRYGFDCVAHADPMTKFPGTASLFYIDVNEAYFIKYSIANNAGWTKANTVYQPSSGCKPTGDYAITHSLNFSQSDINGGDSKITTCVITTPKSSTADGCDWYNYTKTGNASIPTQTVNVGSVSNGKIRVDYYNTSGVSTYWEGSGGTSLTVPQSAIITVTAIPNTGYYNSALTVGGGAFTSGSTYTVTATTAIAATFARSYAFIEGRFRVYNAARNTRTSVGGQGSWVKNSTNIPMSFDGTNGRFELHTYSTPAELKAAFTGGKGDADPYFFIKTSTSSSSISSGTGDGPAEYWATASGNSYQRLTGVGTSNKKGVAKTAYALTFVGNSTTPNGYVILYCDGSYIWYEIEHFVSYNANSASSGTAPSTTYHDNGTNVTLATNTGSLARTGYALTGWNTAANGTGTHYDLGATLNSINANQTLYAEWIAIHEPGVYTKAAASGGYAQTLSTYSNEKYEWYGVYKSSGTNIFLANQTSPGSAPSGDNVVATFTNGSYSINDWMGAIISGNTSSSTSADDEFPSGCNHSVKLLTVNDVLYLVVKGYSQLGILARDADGDRSKKKYLQVVIDGLDVTTSESASGSATARHYDLDASKVQIIRLSGATTSANNYIHAISLKPAAPTVTGPSTTGQELTVGDAATALSVSATPVVAGATLSYQWYVNTTNAATVDNEHKITGATSSSYTPPTTSAGTTYYYCVVSETGCNSTTSSVSGAIVVNEVACGATAPGTISKGTLSGCSITLTASGSAASNNTWYWQASADGTSTSESGATKDVTAPGTYYIRSFYSTGSCWSDAESYTVTASDLTPAAPSALGKSSITAKGVTLAVTDAANTNDYEFYVSTNSSAPGGSTPATHSSNTKSITITNLYAGTTFYAWARAKCGSNKSAWTALTGSNFTTSTVSVTHTLTNVTETSSAATSGVGGSDYTAVYAADEDYSLPTPVVTIGGNTATSGTDYSWASATGTITIYTNKINGNIVITMNSAATAPSSVAISGNGLYFAGETISLTATPTGGNGPVTYQWYKGGKENVNAIEGATSATYTKASCAFGDAGSYYCKVTCGGSQSTWGQSGNAYDVKIPRLYVKTGHYYDLEKSDFGNVDFTRATASTATASIVLGSNGDYCFNIADGCGHYYGNSGTMQYNNTGWITNVSPQDCGLTTTNAGTYIFTINYSTWSQLTTTITFPSCTDPGLAFASASKSVTLCDDAPTNALTNTHGVTVSYASSDETVATVASDGTLTIKKAGTTTITASSLEQTVSAVDYCADEASYTLTVSASTAAGLAYGTSTIKKDVGDDAFTNTLTNSNSLTGITYTSSNTAVATVDEDGEVTIKAAGTTTITASSDQQKITSTCYAAGEVSYTLTVYPVYTVTYNAMGGTCSPTSTNTTTALGKVTLPSATHAIYTTYTWVTSDGTEAGDAGDTYTPEGNINLYAKWSGSCAGGGGSGTSVYKFHTKTGMTPSGTINIDKSVTAVTTSDGDVTAKSGNYLSELSGGTLGMYLNGSNGYLRLANDSCIYYNDNSAYMQPTLSTATIQRGDILRYRISGSAIDVRTSTSGYSANTDVTLATGRNNALVSNSMHGLSSVYLYRNSNSAAYITYFEIYRPSEVLFYAEAATGMTAGNVSATETQRTTSDYLTYINGGNLYTGGNSDGDVKITANELQLKSNNGYIKITLSKELAEGDIIIFNSSNNYQPCITLTKSRSTTISTTNKIYPIPADNSLIGESTIYLWRGSGDTNIRTLAIVRPGGGTCYSVTYHGNGATSGYVNDPAQYAKDADPEVLDCGYTRTGYAFIGWADGTDHRDAETVDYQPGDIIEDISSDVTLYAIWKQIKYFKGTSSSSWNTSGNWSPSGVPARTDPVVIQANVTVDTDEAKALRVDIETGNTLTINAGMALIIAETLTKAGGATEAADVIINSTRAAGVGALIIGGETGTNKATVNFATKVKRESGTGNWINQFIGSPFSDLEPYVDYALQIYEFRPADDGNRGFWHKLSSGDGMEAFWGYNVLYNDNDYLDVQWTGTLNASSNNVTKTGSNEVQTDNLFANSWVAPIHIAAFEEDDFTNFDPTIYIFNAGTPQQEDAAGGIGSGTASASSAGTYAVLPIDAAPWVGMEVIPAMQAFFVKAIGASPSIKFDYSKLVYTPALSSVDITPTRAPRRSAEVAPEVIRLHVAGENGWAENTYVLGREDFTEGYDRGWDGRYMEGEDTNPQLYTPTTDGYMAVNCVPEIEGTVVGFRKGSSDNNYIFSFDYDGDEVWYLNDQKAQKSTQIMNGQTYAFVSEAGDNAARFVISATPINKIATGCESVGAEAAKVRKVIIDDKVYIIRGGQVFDVLGKTIKK